MQGCNWESICMPPGFQTISILSSSLFTVPLLSVPIKGQWISLLHFHVTSSVFDFCLLEIGHGLSIESFDQSCQELDLFILFIWWWPLNWGAYIWQGHALMWAFVAAGHRKKRGPRLSNGRRWRKDDCRCGSRASEPCLSQPLSSNTYLTPYRCPLIAIIIFIFSIIKKTQIPSILSQPLLPLRLTVINIHADDLARQPIGAGNGT